MEAGHDEDEVQHPGRQDRAERRRNIVNAAIVDALPGSVALVDPEGVIRAVNAGWVRFGLERSHDGLLADAGTNYLEVTDRAASDPTAQAAAEAIRAVLAGTTDHAASDYPREDANESERFTMRVAPVDIDDERWAVITHEDVSALRNALDRWHSTFSSAAVPTIIVNQRGEIVDGNGAFAALVGADLPSTIGRSTTDFIHPDSQAEVRRRIGRAGAGRPVLTPQELKLQRPDGTTVIAMMHPSAILPGQTPGTVVQLIDLTQQRRAEARLALHRELLELVAAGTPLAEVATAVAINIGRAIDGAVGSIELAGSAPFTSPGVSSDWVADRDAGRVAIDQSRPALGAVVIATRTGALGPDDEDAAAMLASIVRLALQRDESVARLSGLPSHEQLGETIAWLSRSRATVAVFVVGPIDFDALLAEQGWRGAEAALAEMGANARAIVPGAVVARRGQQILVLVETTSDADAAEIGAQLAKRADVAVGIATARSEDASAEEMLDQAEEALAAARFRSDRVAHFGSSMRERTDADDAADDLRRGIAAGEVVVHYQPIIDLRTGATIGLEALVRWGHPTRGFVPPPELINLAEVCGIIDEVGALVLRTACRDLAAWRRAGVGAPDLTVAVNISAIQLADPGLVSLVQHALAETELDPGALVVEITESVVVTDVDQVAEALAALRELGVRVAIDDFGTGYSSLLYLKRFPADVLKVDRSFVQGLGVHEGDTAIVDAVVGLGHRLGLVVVAEGVETEEQLIELRRRRCDHAQGYLLQRPVGAEEIDRFLRTGAVNLGPEPAVVPATDLDVDELLSLVTHELSTPLSVIGGHAELLADLIRRDDDSPSAVIDALERNIRNLDDLLRSLNDLSHAFGAPGQRAAVELDTFVEQATNDLGPLLAQHDVHVTVTERPVRADVEPVALRQILTNLLSNAVKFTDPGTAIDVTVRSDAQHEVVVADHGRGVPVEREDELFGRYSRLGAQVRGLGLGLHLSRELARRGGGDLVHERTPGGGATFILRIPR